jgi:flagellar biosynthesis/type III secretory pathway protein FliH
MTDQEIIQKYKEKIEQDIQERCKQYNLITEEDKKRFTEKYHRNFIKGLKEGKAEGKIEIVKAALKKNIDIQIIHELTGLSIEAIQQQKEKMEHMACSLA